MLRTCVNIKIVRINVCREKNKTKYIYKILFDLFVFYILVYIRYLRGIRLAQKFDKVRWMARRTKNKNN